MGPNLSRQFHEVRCPRIDESGWEHAVGLVVLTLGEEPSRRLEARIRELIEPRRLGCIPIHLAFTRIVGHSRLSQTDAGGDGDTGEQQVDRCRSIGAAQLNGLGVIGQIHDRSLTGVGVTEHRCFASRGARARGRNGCDHPSRSRSAPPDGGRGAGTK